MANVDYILPIGAEVSAKYRGAFCEAHVDKITRRATCSVVFNDVPGKKLYDLNSESDIRGNIRLGETVEARHAESGQWLPAVIKKIVDHSLYTVVFNDGDIRQLRRSHLCRKGDRHFSGDESLDNAPLTNPDHFGTPVGKKRSRFVIPLERTPAHSHANTPNSSPSKQRVAPGSPVYEGHLAEWLGKVVCVTIERGATSANNSLSESVSRTPQSASGGQLGASASGTFQTPGSSEDAVSKQKSATTRKETSKKRRLAAANSDEQCESEEGSSVKSTQSASTRASSKNQPGSPASAKQTPSTTRSASGTSSPKQTPGTAANTATWYPALVCLPSAALVDADLSRLQKGYLLVRSFKDGRFTCIARKNVTEFTSELALKYADRDRSLRAAVEKALAYIDTRELPPSWNRAELLGSTSDDEASASGDEGAEHSDDESIDERAREASDRFVAQLYTFMDDRGTPINKAPAIANRDLDLYRLHRIVREMGGFNRVSTQLRWRVVYSRMQLPPSSSASSLLKTAYRKYILPYDEFQRKLGFGSLEHTYATDTSLRRSTLNASLGSHSTSAAAASPPHSTSAAAPVTTQAHGQASTTSTNTPHPAANSSLSASSSELQNTDSLTDASPSAYASPTKSVSASSSPHPSASAAPVSAGPPNNVAAIGRVTRHAPTGRRLFAPRGTKLKRGTSTNATQKETEASQPAALSTVKESDSEKDTDSAAPAQEVATAAVTVSAGGSDKKASNEPTRRNLSRSTDNVPSAQTETPKRETESVASVPTVSAPSNIVAGNADSEQKPLVVGTRIRVRYTDARTYEAKVIDVDLGNAQGSQSEGTVASTVASSSVTALDLEAVRYKIHYAGWNNRHDEWIRRDRIVRVVDENEPSNTKKRAESGANRATARKRGGASRSRVTSSKRSRDGAASDSDAEKRSDNEERREDDADSTSTPADGELQASFKSRTSDDSTKPKAKDEISAKVKVECTDEAAASASDDKSTQRSDSQRDERAANSEREDEQSSSAKQKSNASSSKRTLRKRKPSVVVAESSPPEGENVPQKAVDETPPPPTAVAKGERSADDKEATPGEQPDAAPQVEAVSENERHTDSPQSNQARERDTTNRPAKRPVTGSGTRKKAEAPRGTPGRSGANSAVAADSTVTQPTAAQTTTPLSTAETTKPSNVLPTICTSTSSVSLAQPTAITVSPPQDSSNSGLQVSSGLNPNQTQRSPAASRSPAKVIAAPFTSPVRAQKFNFLVTDLDRLDRERRIEVLQEKITELRKVYAEIRSEVLDIDRKRKRLKQREKEERELKEKEGASNASAGGASCPPGSLIAAPSGSCTSISTLTSTTLSDST